MIGTIITGRGNNREVIERPRNLAFSQALAASLKKYLGIPAGAAGYKSARATSRGRALGAAYGQQRRAKRVSVTH